MAQEQETLDPVSDALSILRSLAPLNETEARAFLHQFLFSGDEVFTPVSKLSYGERARLLLACLVASGCNLLLLDEPINHLDVPSRARFEQALANFDGTVLAVVHDRYFIQGFASEIWEIEGGKLKSGSEVKIALLTASFALRSARRRSGLSQQHLGDALGGMPVPELDGLAGRSRARGGLLHGLQDRLTVAGNQPVGALRDRNRALGGRADGQAGDTQEGGLLLDAARNRSAPGPPLPSATGSPGSPAARPAGRLRRRRPSCCHALPGARVDRENHLPAAGQSPARLKRSPPGSAGHPRWRGGAA